MSSSHFPGGPKPPLPRTSGFTLNRFTVEGSSPEWRPKAASPGRGGFIPPVGALRHGRCRKPFIICSCKKCARKCFGICTYKSLDLKFPRISSYKNRGGVG